MKNAGSGRWGLRRLKLGWNAEFCQEGAFICSACTATGRLNSEKLRLLKADRTKPEIAEIVPSKKYGCRFSRGFALAFLRIRRHSRCLLNDNWMPEKLAWNVGNVRIRVNPHSQDKTRIWFRFRKNGHSASWRIDARKELSCNVRRVHGSSSCVATRVSH